MPRRHTRSSRRRRAPAGGLVLLDLPDFDSVQLDHRLEVDRLVELVDLLVWVLDPQKYADGALHDRYLRPLAGHAGVMLVVLNQIDRLDPAAREPPAWPTCAGCWAGRGSARCRCSASSARDRRGAGRRCGTRWPTRAAARRAAVQRLEADLARTAAALRPSCPDGAAAPASASRTGRRWWMR